MQGQLDTMVGKNYTSAFERECIGRNLQQTAMQPSDYAQLVRKTASNYVETSSNCTYFQQQRHWRQ